MIQVTPPDFFTDPIEYIRFYWTQIFPYLVLIITLIILLIIYVVITRLARKSLQSIGMGAEASTGIVIILRLIFFMAAVSVIITTFETSFATILSLSAIFGTALGLAFSQALGNIVSGLYVLTARPFRVGDYVKIGNVEGIVREITLNYTRILLADETTELVPNNKVVSSAVTNYRIDISNYIQKIEADEKQEILAADRGRNYVHHLGDALNRLKQITGIEEAYRYTFDISIHMSYKQTAMMKWFNQVCDKWSEIFVTRPTYQVWAKPTAAVTYRFAYIVEDPMTIIRRGSDFLNELLEKYYEGP
ncbi:mechanosensitive ion channel [Candidatus Thorarchaeota archaeon]|nr:MAG: mechanosensitive ion channel [Candidatus Thorarchaeota archaeon]